MSAQVYREWGEENEKKNHSLNGKGSLVRCGEGLTHLLGIEFGMTGLSVLLLKFILSSGTKALIF